MPARASTELDAANIALGELGEPPIASLDDGNARARSCKQWFGQVRDAVLAERHWGFATAWSTPAAATAKSLGPLKTRYPLNADCIAVRFLANPTTGEQNTDEWDMEAATINPGDTPAEAKILVTNAASPLVCYTRRIEVPRLWDAEFLEVFGKRLAAAIAPFIARDINAAQKKTAEADAKLDTAALIDAREESPQRVSRDTSWNRARRVGITRRWMGRW